MSRKLVKETARSRLSHDSTGEHWRHLKVGEGISEEEKRVKGVERDVADQYTEWAMETN